MMPTENLQTAQLVARVTNTMGRVSTEDIHLLKLANHRRTIIGNGRADSR